MRNQNHNVYLSVKLANGLVAAQNPASAMAGCITAPSGSRLIDLTNQTFGHLTVITIRRT
jgi:hypothetical protein